MMYMPPDDLRPLQIEVQCRDFGFKPYPQGKEFKLKDDHVYQRHHIHTFQLNDTDDPEIYAAQPIWEWQQTDKGKWVMEHALDPTYSISVDPMNYGYVVVIHAHMLPKDWTEYLFRFDMSL